MSPLQPVAAVGNLLRNPVHRAGLHCSEPIGPKSELLSIECVFGRPNPSIGLLSIGVTLILGVFVNLAAAAGALLLVMMWTAVLPPENNPFMDDHLIYAMVLVVLALTAAGRTLGFGRVWERLPIVQRYGFLK